MDQAVTPVASGARLSLGVLAAFAGIYIIWGTTYLAIAFAIQTHAAVHQRRGALPARGAAHVCVVARAQSATRSRA